MTRDEWNEYCIATAQGASAEENFLKSQEAKSDAGKPQLSLVPEQIVWDIAEVRAYGNKKYHDPDNWRDVDIQRHWEACLRHTLRAWKNIRAVDPESGILHLKHLACDLSFVLQLLEEENADQKTEDNPLV